jgi:hypothetical protein
MAYVNVGAYIGTANADGETVTGERVASKAALKAALKERPGEVLFDVTAMIHNGPKLYRGDEIPQGVNLSVVGPDPYTSRKWYATVALTSKGGVSVK